MKPAIPCGVALTPAHTPAWTTRLEIFSQEPKRERESRRHHGRIVTVRVKVCGNDS